MPSFHAMPFFDHRTLSNACVLWSSYVEEREEKVMDNNCCSSVSFPHKPHQPKNFSFLKRIFGQSVVMSRSFQPSWFNKWPWLHYNEGNDIVIWHIGTKANVEKLWWSMKADASFVTSSFATGNWLPQNLTSINVVSDTAKQYWTLWFTRSDERYWWNLISGTWTEEDQK